VSGENASERVGIPRIYVVRTDAVPLFERGGIARNRGDRVSAPQRFFQQAAADVACRPDDRDLAHATFSFAFTAFAPASLKPPVLLKGNKTVARRALSIVFLCRSDEIGESIGARSFLRA
jgi:hypothetical protein